MGQFFYLVYLPLILSHQIILSSLYSRGACINIIAGTFLALQFGRSVFRIKINIVEIPLLRLSITNNIPITNRIIVRISSLGSDIKRASHFI